MNFKNQEPDIVLDFHHMTTSECKIVLDELFSEYDNGYIRFIVGKGLNSENGPVLPYFVQCYLREKNIDFILVDGAIDVVI